MRVDLVSTARLLQTIGCRLFTLANSGILSEGATSTLFRCGFLHEVFRPLFQRHAAACRH
jgi:hypothetical protein